MEGQRDILYEDNLISTAYYSLNTVLSSVFTKMAMMRNVEGTSCYFNIDKACF